MKSGLKLYILPFKKNPCFKIGITYDIYLRGSQLGFENFEWAAAYLVEAAESHTIIGIESFLKKQLGAFQAKEVPELSSGTTEVYSGDALTTVLSMIQCFSSMPSVSLRITKGIPIEAILAERVGVFAAARAIVQQRKPRRRETAFFKFEQECRETIGWLRALNRRKALTIMGPVDDLWAVIVLDREIQDVHCEFNTRYRVKGCWGSEVASQSGSALYGDHVEIRLDFAHIAYRFRHRLAKLLASILPNVIPAVRSRSQEAWPAGFLASGSEEVYRMAKSLGLTLDGGD